MRKLLSIFILLSAVVISGLSAQNITINAKLDSTVILIGSQTKLTYQVTQKPGMHVLIPVFTDSIPGGLELAEPLKLDTTKADGGNNVVTLNYVVTSFHDSLLYIPAFPFVVGGDTVWSKSLSLKVVQPYVIDITKPRAFDIKSVMDGPFDWVGLLWVIFFILLIHGLLVLGIWVYRKYFKTEPVLDKKSQELLLPPHVVALGYLDQIKQSKPWQQGRSKEYHTELTDVLRSYIERMFNINCLEMTSEEILEEFRLMRLDQKSVFMSLKQILTLADLVKFAKWEPNPDEHELSLMNAYLFVNQTKVEEVAPLDELKPEEEK